MLLLTPVVGFSTGSRGIFSGFPARPSGIIPISTLYHTYIIYSMLIFSFPSIFAGNFPFFRSSILAREVEMLTLARQWLAAELHDDAGQQLRVLRMQLHILAMEHPETDMQLLRDGLSRLQSCLQQLVGEEEQAVFDRRRFELQVERLLQDLRWAGLTVRQEGCWPESWEAGVEELWHLYRMMQELVQNVLAHADADLLVLAIEQDGRYLRIGVRDRGRGTGAGGGTGMGSRNLRRRAELIGAEVQRRCHHDGTEVTITISIQKTKIQ